MAQANAAGSSLCFSLLPRELQDQIWDEVLFNEPPNVLTLTFGKHSKSSGKAKGQWNSRQSHFKVSYILPTSLLHTCNASRQRAQRVYARVRWVPIHRLFGPNAQTFERTIYISWMKDIFFIDQAVLRSWDYSNRSNRPRIQEALSNFLGSETGRVLNVAFHPECFHPWDIMPVLDTSSVNRVVHVWGQNAANVMQRAFRHLRHVYLCAGQQPKHEQKSAQEIHEAREIAAQRQACPGGTILMESTSMLRKYFKPRNSTGWPDFGDLWETNFISHYTDLKIRDPSQPIPKVHFVDIYMARPRACLVPGWLVDVARRYPEFRMGLLATSRSQMDEREGGWVRS